ncbi:MAG TPA: glycoside hydrolase family 3 N-terminal domain-containing protein [Ilumatobacter sp.]|nr:glycoside hydrolase family 3 N-terminal domain-containing protein [Ilumatobacter sp.]
MTTDDAPYRDSSASIGDRVADLMARMTIDEKLAQLGSAWVFQLATASGFDAARAAPVLAHGIGHITRVCGASGFTSAEAAAFNNDLQRHLLEHTRLGIPAIVHEEICAGLMAREGTVFPQAIGVAATFRPDLNAELADAVRLQMRAIGAHHGLSPVLDLCRDPRWGRLEETYGEDPQLVTQMGLAYIRGLQGDDLADGVVATAKHFVGYGASEGGFNWAPAHLNDRELRDVYLRPFEAAVRVARLGSVMNGYHEIDGVPCGANPWLLDELLRGEWGFDGTVVSDYFAIRQLEDYHHVAASGREAAALALTSGVDVELPGTDCYAGDLRDALNDGSVTTADVDRAVVRVLESKFRLGLFDRACVDTAGAGEHTRTSQQIGLARRIATDSLVLLRNDGVLPMRSPASVAVIGPNAATPRNMVGDYAYVCHVESLLDMARSGGSVFAVPIDRDMTIDDFDDLSHIGTVLDCLTARLPEASVGYAQGCGVNDDDRSGFENAVRLAAQADVAVVVVGDKAGLTPDCTTGETRDVASLSLPGVQEELVMAVAATGTPVVLVLVAGRPIGSPAVHAAAAAVLHAWLPGEAGADAISDALIGTVNPGGKLPISYPRSSGQIPVFYGHKVSGGRSFWRGEYVDMSNRPLYPFGFGLSYTTFEVAPAPLDDPIVTTGDTLIVSVAVRNAGQLRGDEVVQIYTRDPVASVTRPVLELQAFARVSLDPGEQAILDFEIAVADLGFHDRAGRYVVEAGEIQFFAGTSATDLTSAGTVTVKGDPAIVAQRTFTNVARVRTAR